MYILRNAAKNLLRNKGRNILISIIILTMLSVAAVSMVINTTTEKILEDYKTRFGSEVTFRVNPQKVQEMITGSNDVFSLDIPEISFEQYFDFAKSQHLKETMFTASYAGFGKNVKGIGQDEWDSLFTGEGNFQMQRVGGDNYNNSNLTVMAYSANTPLTDFANGTREITSGKMFETDEQCIISEDFARLNGLKVGDIIEIADTSKDVDSILKLTITGVYFDGNAKPANGGPLASMPTMPNENRKNDVITTLDTLLDYREALKSENPSSATFVALTPTYILKNPDLLRNFTNEVRGKGLADVYDVTTDATNYNQIIKPVEGISNVSSIFLILVLTIGALILVIVSTLAIRERKYEIGVLRAMGMKKSKVARGLIYETLITITFCLILGTAIGSAFAQPVSNIMLEGQIKAAESAKTQMNNGMSFYFTEDSTNDIETLKEIQVSLSPEAVARVAGIAILLGVLSSAVGLIYILRYEPMKILSERN